MHPLIKEVLVSNEDIQKKSKELGEIIDKDYENDQAPLLVALLRGSVPFLAELIKHIKTDVQYDFMDVSSYFEGTQSVGEIKVLKDLDTSIKGENVLIVEDIVDTGHTLSTVKEMLLSRGAKSVKIVTLLDKPSRRVVDVKVDYIGFEIPNEFVVGFGLDFNQKFRNLPYIGVLKDECYK